MKKLLLVPVLFWGAVCNGMAAHDLFIGASVPVFKQPDEIDKLLAASSRGDSVAVKALLEKGAPVNAHNPYSHMTALHYAAASGNIDTVIVLIWYNADLDAQNTEYETPLHKAVGGGNGDIVRLLLACGADRLARDEVGLTPFHWMAFEETPQVCEKAFQGLLMDNVFANAQAAKERAFCVLLLINRNMQSEVETSLPCELWFTIIESSDELLWDVIRSAGASSCASDTFAVFLKKLVKRLGPVSPLKCKKLIIDRAAQLALAACTTPSHQELHLGEHVPQTPYDIAVEQDNAEVASLVDPKVVKAHVTRLMTGWLEQASQ